MNTMIPLYGFGGGGGIGAVLTVSAPAGAAVTVAKGDNTKTKTASDGRAVFRGLESGIWTVTITNGTDTASKTMEIRADYETKISFLRQPFRLPIRRA